VNIMEIRPTPDQEALIRQAIAAGRIGQPEDAGQEAMALWEERERRRVDILAAVDAAEASLASGEGCVVTPDSMRQLAESVKQRGRARLAAEKAGR
jgi:Arc/MetJ-type ribon-helix-helix transcriptional regulator